MHDQGRDRTARSPHRESHAHPSQEPSSHQPPSVAPSFIPPHGGYEELLSFRKARIVYDATFRFCERFVDERNRYRTYIDTRPAHVVANIIICCIHQANYLLDQQIRRLERDFLNEGGLKERMTRARLLARSRQKPGQPPEP